MQQKIVLQNITKELIQNLRDKQIFVMINNET